MTIISPPVPAYSNPPIEPENYAPGVFVITALSTGATTTVSVAPTPFGVNCNYVVGQLVRILIPQPYGCRQLNDRLAYVINVPTTNQVVLSISSIGADLFIAASTPTKPQLVAVGDVNTGNINGSGRLRVGTTIPGGFINVSP